MKVVLGDAATSILRRPLKALRESIQNADRDAWHRCTDVCWLTRELIDKNAPDALVMGYESLIPSLNLPDEKDRHVLAAAIQSKASVIGTKNLKDFPKESLQEFEIEAQSPDEFLLNLLDLAPEDVYEAAEDRRLGLKNPPKTVAEYLSTPESEGLVRTVAKLRLALLNCLRQPTRCDVGCTIPFASD